MKKKFVSWRRVSTAKQSKSGLGLAAQKEIIRYFIEREQGDWIADYSECYTGTELSGCVQLRRAIEHCKRENAVLVIAKTDRFRNTIEALQVYEEMGEGNIMFCDLPHTDKFTLTLFFALAEREALIVSIRTKQALAAKKAAGARLGASSEKYKEAIKRKSVEVRHKECAQRGERKRQNFLQTKDVCAFVKILRNVFPWACMGEPDKWAWQQINTRRENRLKVLQLMQDYQAIDANNKLFANWNFTDVSSKRLQQKLSAYICTLQRSYRC